MIRSVNSRDSWYLMAGFLELALDPLPVPNPSLPPKAGRLCLANTRHQKPGCVRDSCSEVSKQCLPLRRIIIQYSVLPCTDDWYPGYGVKSKEIK